MGILKEFIMEDFDLKKPFSSFLPGIAGIKGIPLWTYYANRGQGITSVGSKDKNGCIIEFHPAYYAYDRVTTQGFRTFLRVNDELVEPFAPRLEKDHLIRRMYITGADFSIEEINNELGYKIEVKYFGLPNMPIGALARRVKLTSFKNQIIEIVDGTSQIIPHGVSNDAYKNVGNLMRSWMDVYYIKERAPFCTMRSSSADEAEVSEVTSGNFYLSVYNGELLDAICDIEVIFGHDSSRTKPINLYKSTFEELTKVPQIVVNKVPCAFTGTSKKFKENEFIQIDSLLGYLPHYDLLLNHLCEIKENDFFDKKEIEAQKLISDLTNDIKTETANPMFDEYIRQSYLDNFLRGGYPVNLGTEDKPIPHYVYSRKHGDPERDYNWFNLEPEYYSQGNGNFRDVNQNRRSDVIFNDFVKDKSIKLFLSLTTLDGYNPLVINGSTYELLDTVSKEEISLKILGKVDEKFIAYLSNDFTPGGIINYFVKNNLQPLLDDMAIFDLILNNSKEKMQAVFGEGYWVDHFSYDLDLIESYLWVYPDKEKELLFDDYGYSYYYSPMYVLPRIEKIGKTHRGTIRQYGSLKEISKEEKEAINYKPYVSNWAKDKLGNTYQTNLASKLISLVVNKFTLRDPEGYGVMMEADKPGWNDAMNGLPGVLASGVSESIELGRIIEFIFKAFNENKTSKIKLPLHLANLSFRVQEYLKDKVCGKLSDSEYYELVISAVEEYRAKMRLGIVEEEKECVSGEFLELLSMMKSQITEKLNNLNSKFEVLPSYLVYDVEEYEELEGKTPYGLNKVKVLSYKMRPLPVFLEAPSRYLKLQSIPENSAKRLYEAIRKTDLYDKKLKMYRTSVDLDSESLENGRIRAFTKGWLERESNFMHMTFKYLYGLLKSKMYKEFYDEIKTNFPAFMDPNVYGRSVFENSSFIATSCNPNPNIHGTGFVARLSGSNTEVISMWLIMMFGHQPFYYEEGKLCLQLNPVLPIDYFKEGVVKVQFLKSIEITYINHSNRNTYDGLKPISYELINEFETKVVKCSVLVGQDAEDVRNKKYSKIIVKLG